VRRDVAVADIASAAALLPFTLSASATGCQERGNAKSKQQGEQGEKILHEGSSQKKCAVRQAGRALPLVSDARIYSTGT
jgi:hypothetical protein